MQVTLVPVDGKIRAGDRVIAFSAAVADQLDVDLSVVHAVQYDTETGAGHVEYRPGAERLDLEDGQRGTRITSTLGDAVKLAFDAVWAAAESAARLSAAVRKAELEVETDGLTATVLDSSGTDGLAAGQTVYDGNGEPVGTAVDAVVDGQTVALTQAVAPGLWSDLTFANDDSVLLVDADVATKYDEADALNFATWPTYGLDLTDPNT